MKEIRMKPARHICAVPGCRCTETYRIIGSVNALGGIFLCADCIAAAARQLKKPAKRGSEA